jgi:sugar O-acyltransferase (sialic acid O-acetyltransferase NeuD family)
MAGGSSRPLLIFPCNGNGIEALDALGDAFHCVGFIDDTPAKQAQGCLGLPVWDRSALDRLADAAVLAVPGGPASFRTRRQVIDALGVDAGRWATVIHPRASVSPRASIGRNVLLMAGVVITSNAVVGDHVCVLPNSVVHHDSVVGPATLVGANVAIAGGVTIGECSYVASGSNIRHGLRLGDACLVGLGSNVLADVASRATVAGNPARELSGHRPQ